jgi:hypothetical protein
LLIVKTVQDLTNTEKPLPALFMGSKRKLDQTRADEANTTAKKCRTTAEASEIAEVLSFIYTQKVWTHPCLDAFDHTWQQEP